MSFLKKLFGRDFDGALTRAESLADEGRLGEAVLAFREALDGSKGVPAERVEKVREKLRGVQDALAREHMETGKRLAEEGQIERAIEAFETAAGAAASVAVQDEVQALIDQLDASDARAAFEDADELDEDERYAVLAGEWGEDQADELDGYGEPFKRAFLAMWDGDPKGAAEAMSAIAEEEPDALFLYVVLAHAHLLAEDHEKSVEAATHFLERLDDVYGEEHEEEDDEDEHRPVDIERETTAARVRAHDIMAAAYKSAGDRKKAEKQLRALVDLLPDKAAPYVVLGRFLREDGRPEEAVEVLEEGRAFMGEIQPDMRVPSELGLAYLALGREAEAEGCLQAVVDHRIGMDVYDFPVEVAVPLAEVYSKKGDKRRASDLYRHLAAGSYTAGHFSFNLRAAELLLELEDLETARRYAVRASELAEDDETKAKISPILEKLGDPEN